MGRVLSTTFASCCADCLDDAGEEPLFATLSYWRTQMNHSPWRPPGACCNWPEVGGRSDAMLRLDLDLDLGLEQQNC